VGKWLCKVVVVKVQLAECLGLWNWKRNEVVVHLKAHLNEIQAAEDDTVRRLSWMRREEEEEGRNKNAVEGFEFADNALLSVLRHSIGRRAPGDCSRNGMVGAD
jgi:hypothetical protein